jgi:hypothetical protein
MGAMIGVIAAASARADADLLERFRIAGATAPERAQPLDRLGVSDSPGVTRYLTDGVICRSPSAADRYYLDEVALAAYRRRKRPAMVVAGLVVMGLALILGATVMMVTARR